MTTGPSWNGRHATTMLVAAIAGLASTGYSQVARPSQNVRVIVAPTPDRADRGWIGIGVELSVPERQSRPGALVVRVVRTVEGGPAARAGVVPGDIIEEIDGEPITVDRWRDFIGSIRTGTDLRLTLERAGRAHEVDLVTASRPSLAPAPVGLTTHLDSVRNSFQIQLRSNQGRWSSRDYVDALISDDAPESSAARLMDRTRVAGMNGGAASNRPDTALLSGLLSPNGPDGNRYSVLSNTDGALPFEYLMLRSAAADSVRMAMIRLRGELNQVSAAARLREREIKGLIELRAIDLSAADAQLARLREDDERVRRDLERLSFRLAEIRSSEREDRARNASADSPGWVVSGRSVTAGVAGQNLVGGAQLNDLNPQLGAYFGVDRGVLVIQVLPGTPSDDAGLVPGDVVTRVGGREIESVATFRAALKAVFAREREAELLLLRRGELETATLSR